MKLVAVSINHQTADQDLRGCLSLAEADITPFLHSLTDMPGVDEAVVLSTCNRVEVYLAAADDSFQMESVVERLALYKSMSPDRIEGNSLRFYDRDVVAHLFRVVSSLDSMVVGEAQILGQVKAAYAAAKDAGATGPHLNYLFQRAFAVAKKIRTNFGLGQGKVSVASMAVDFAEKLFGDLAHRKALVVGTGKMGILTLRYLRDKGMTRMWVISRSLERARTAALEFDGLDVTGADWDQVDDLLLECDVLITSTAHPDVVFDAERMTRAMKRRRGRPLMTIDLALPRDVAREAADVPGVYLYDLDGLRETAQENAAEREREVTEALCVVQENVERFIERASLRAEKKERLGLRNSGIGIEARGLTKGFLGAELFRDLSFQCQSGRCLSVVGPNGSGKSTLLRVLSGLIRPDQGEVAFRVDGRSFGPREARPLLGSVAPDHRLYDELTAEENLLFFARLRGISLSRKLVRNHLEEVGLAAASKGPIRHFSSGMRQRLSFACALVHRPQFLFLDEPGAFLDKAGRDLLRQVIRNVCGSGGITILATNDPEEAGYGDMELRLGI